MRFLISLVHFLRLGRPLFLVGGVVFHVLGVVMAIYEGAVMSLPALLWGQLAVTATQIMTHYSNDYFDLEADLANLTPTRWSGGSRVLLQGIIPPVLALGAAVVAGVVALGASLVVAFVVRPGPLALPLLLLAVLLAWSYSSPPLQLHSTGAGEVLGAMLVTGLTPIVGYYLQAGRLTLLPILAVVPLVILQFVMLLVIEFPDEYGDALAGKETLVVRLGAGRAARVLLAALLLFYLVLPLLVVLGLPLAAGVAVAVSAAPGILWMAWRLHQGKWAEAAWWNWFGFVAVTLVVTSAIVQVVVFASLAS